MTFLNWCHFFETFLKTYLWQRFYRPYFPPQRGEQNPLMWGFIPHAKGGISDYMVTLAIQKPNNRFSLSMFSVSAVRNSATTSKSGNLGTGPRCGTFPDSLTRFSEKSLCNSSILTNFVWRMYLRWAVFDVSGDYSEGCIDGGVDCGKEVWPPK